MRAMVLREQRRPLRLEEPPEPEPGSGQVLLRVRACGVCRTDLHVVDGDLAEPKLPLIPGHQIVATVEATGEGAERFEVGRRVGVPWLGWTDGDCRYCLSGRENLCERARFTGYQLDGGYAEMAVADERFCLPIPDDYPDLQAAPLLCAGLIGYRSLRLCGEGAGRIGLYGFGASAHIICQVAAHQGREVYALTQPGDVATQRFALGLGASWAGDTEGGSEVSERGGLEPLDAAIIFAPAGELIPVALRAVAPGGTGGLRRDPHERHPVISLRHPLGRADPALGGQPDPRRRRGVHGPGARGAGPDIGHRVRTGARKPGARRPARR